MQLARLVTLCSVHTPFPQPFPTTLLFYWNLFLTLSRTAVLCHGAALVLWPGGAGGSVTDPSARDNSAVVWHRNPNLQDKWQCRRDEFTKWKMLLWCCNSFLTVSLLQLIQLPASGYYPNPRLFLISWFLHWYSPHTRESFLPLGPDVTPAAETCEWGTTFGNGWRATGCSATTGLAVCTLLAKDPRNISKLSAIKCILGWAGQEGRSAAAFSPFQHHFSQKQERVLHLK